MDSAGEALAVWEAPGDAVQESRLASGQTSFGAAATLGTTSASPWVAMDEGGEAVVDWPISGAIEVATSPAGGDFGTTEQVGAGGTPELAKVSMALDGAVALAWLNNTPGNGCISELGSVRPPGGAFAKADGEVSCGSGRLGTSSLQIAGDSVGDTLAIWQETTTIGNNMRGLVYDVGPSLSAVAIPTTAQVGQPVSFGMASPVSVWRPVIGVTWKFGDGATASGLSATHTYTQLGEYHVVASAADAQLLAPGLPFERHVENSVTGTILVTPSPVGPSPKTTTPLAVPAITHVHESHRVWRERIPRKHWKGPPVGTTFTFALNEQASVRFAFTRLPGKCRSHTGRHHGRSCPRPVAAGSLSLAGHSGTNTLHFRGKLASARWLAPGNYSLTITAANGAGRSRATSLAFTILG